MNGNPVLYLRQIADSFITLKTLLSWPIKVSPWYQNSGVHKNWTEHSQFSNPKVFFKASFISIFKIKTNFDVVSSWDRVSYSVRFLWTPEFGYHGLALHSSKSRTLSKMSTYFILWDGVPAARWGCQNPPDPSLTVCGEKSSEIRVTWDCGNADFSLTAEDVPIYRNARFLRKCNLYKPQKVRIRSKRYSIRCKRKVSFKNATFSKFWIQIELLTDYASSQNAKFHVSFSYLREK